MRITIELADLPDHDAAALCAWLEMQLREEGVTEIRWSKDAG